MIHKVICQVLVEIQLYLIFSVHSSHFSMDFSILRAAESELGQFHLQIVKYGGARRLLQRSGFVKPHVCTLSCVLLARPSVQVRIFIHIRWHVPVSALNKHAGKDGNDNNKHGGAHLTHSEVEVCDDSSLHKFELRKFAYCSKFCALVDLDSSGSKGVRPTPGLTSSTQGLCVCVRAYTSTHPPTTLTPAKIEKYTRQNPCLYPCQNIASHATNQQAGKKHHFQTPTTHAWVVEKTPVIHTHVLENWTVQIKKMRLHENACTLTRVCIYTYMHSYTQTNIYT